MKRNKNNKMTGKGGNKPKQRTNMIGKQTGAMKDTEASSNLCRDLWVHVLNFYTCWRQIAAQSERVWAGIRHPERREGGRGGRAELSWAEQRSQQTSQEPCVSENPDSHTEPCLFVCCDDDQRMKIEKADKQTPASLSSLAKSFWLPVRVPSLLWWPRIFFFPFSLCATLPVLRSLTLCCHAQSDKRTDCVS